MNKRLVFGLTVFTILFLSSVSYSADGVSEKKEDLSRKNEFCVWCDEIGMYDLMHEIKETTKVLTVNMMYKKWPEIKSTATKLRALYESLNFKSPTIPADYWEFHEDFLRYFGRFEAAVEKKDEKDSEFQFQRVKTACHHCHVRYVRRKQTDDGIALERMYKDQFKEWGDGKSYDSKPNW